MSLERANMNCEACFEYAKQNKISEDVKCPLDKTKALVEHDKLHLYSNEAMKALEEYASNKDITNTDATSKRLLGVCLNCDFKDALIADFCGGFFLKVKSKGLFEK